MTKEHASDLVISNSTLEVTQSSLPSPLTNTYIHLATSANTRKAYQSDIRHYESWGGKLPATTEMIVCYLHFYATKLNPRTLARRVIAIRHWHTYQGFQDPTLHSVIKKTLIGILRTHGKPKDKARALTIDELAKIYAHLKRSQSLTALRDNALIQLGFFGAFRRSELVAIHFEHMKWLPEGVEILIPHSKTDKNHEGQFSIIPYGNETLCPILALQAWMNVANIKSGPIFRRILGDNRLGTASLTPLSVNHILKNRANEVGIKDIASISSHSLRRGLATNAARAGAPLQAIMRAGRWKQTNTVMEYIEESDRFTDNAAANVLQKFTATKA